MSRVVNSKKRHSLQNRRAKKQVSKIAAARSSQQMVGAVNAAILSSDVVVPTMRLAKMGKNNAIIKANKLSNKKIRLLTKAINRQLPKDTEMNIVSPVKEVQETAAMDTESQGTVLGAPSC